MKRLRWVSFLFSTRSTSLLPKRSQSLQTFLKISRETKPSLILQRAGGVIREERWTNVLSSSRTSCGKDSEMTLDDIWAQLESDLYARQAEIRLLSNGI